MFQNITAVSHPPTALLLEAVREFALVKNVIILHMSPECRKCINVEGVFILQNGPSISKMPLDLLLLI